MQQYVPLPGQQRECSLSMNYINVKHTAKMLELRGVPLRCRLVLANLYQTRVTFLVFLLQPKTDLLNRSRSKEVNREGNIESLPER